MVICAKQKIDDDTIIAIKNIDVISIFTINCPSLVMSICMDNILRNHD